MATLRISHSLSFVAHLLLLMNLLHASGPDSLAYTFRQDNLSIGNELGLKYEHDFGQSQWQITDLLRYKEFAFESSLAQGRQYSIEHQLQSDLSWGTNWSKTIRIQSNDYQDHRTGLASNISNQAVLGGLKHGQNIAVFTGARSVERFGIVDRGWTTELDFNETWRGQRSRANLGFTGERDALDEHLSHAARTRASYQIDFKDVASFQTILALENRVQAFFTDSLGSSQSRLNENRQWRTRFEYQLNQGMSLFHRLTWNDQFTRIDQEKVSLLETIRIEGEDRNRFSLVNETGITLNRQHLSSATAFKVENSQHKYYVDYTQRLYQLSEDLRWSTPAWIDSLNWNTVLSRLEYDTPDTTNDDDRDEWRFNTELEISWQPNPFYRVEVGSKLSLFHLIYLFNTRSSENHWNRNLMFWSGLNWQRQQWSGESRGRVRSNYFDYDHDELFLALEQPTRSFVHRSLDLQQTIQYQFFSRWSVSAKGVAKWEDEGQLDWAAFIQQVRSEREQLEWVIKVYYDYKGWKGWLGYLQHDRVTKYAAPNRDPENWFGEGPLLGVQHQLGARLFVDADARFIQVQDQDREYLLPKVYLTLVYR